MIAIQVWDQTSSGWKHFGTATTHPPVDDAIHNIQKTGLFVVERLDDGDNCVTLRIQMKPTNSGGNEK